VGMPGRQLIEIAHALEGSGDARPADISTVGHFSADVR
jgi:hypothetical protein